MYKLAKLASEGKRTRATEKRAINLLLVDQVQRDISGYSNEHNAFFKSSDTEAALNARRDNFHCAEAWRHALFLYILRVFKMKLVSAQEISYTARVVLDHVRSIRQVGWVQKQVLIPVFLAGAEISGEYGQQLAQDYCDFWTKKNRYFMFDNVAILHRQIWKERKASKDNDFWWALVVDKHEKNSPTSMTCQFLLG